MTEIERKALALLNEVAVERGYNIAAAADRRTHYLLEAICRAIEQREAYKREVSDAVEEWHSRWVGAGESHSYFMSLFSHFIIPKPVDPLVEVLDKLGWSFDDTGPDMADDLREALAGRGLEIREIEQ